METLSRWFSVFCFYFWPGAYRNDELSESKPMAFLSPIVEMVRVERDEGNGWAHPENVSNDHVLLYQNAGDYRWMNGELIDILDPVPGFSEMYMHIRETGEELCGIRMAYCLAMRFYEHEIFQMKGEKSEQSS